MRQGFGRFLLPADAAMARGGPLQGCKYNRDPQMRQLSTGEPRFPKRSCFINALSIHIKGAIGGKVMGRPEGHEPSGIDRPDPAFPILPDASFVVCRIRCVSDFLD
jgi:hypothetical protein